MPSRHFLTILDFEKDRLGACIKLAARCKRNPGFAGKALFRKTIALLFEKPSLRTRVSFTVAARQLGAVVIDLRPEEVQIGRREPVKDVARTLSRYVDAIVARTFEHRQIEHCAMYASVPVINGLSATHHPCQTLADLLTIKECLGGFKGLRVGYVGDGNNVLHSLAQGSALMGISLRAATPSRFGPDRHIWEQAMEKARLSKSLISWGTSPRWAAEGADVLYTDVWTSMGQESQRARRRRAMHGFKITRELLKRAARHCIVMHCLPAHRGEEIDEEVLEGAQSVVFDQAENRMHAQKALLLLLMGGI